jgi:hypothetical protein
MLNNPDIQPNATINRWIAGILLFDFKLVHVPGATHGPDGLSRRPAQQIAGGVWAAQAVGGMSAGVRPRLVVLPPSPGVGAAGWCCVVALRCGPAVALGLHDTGLGVGHRWHLHGVGLAGAWVWGTVATCPVWSGPGWCSGHWCGLAVPRNVEMTAVSGAWQLGHLLCPGTSGRGCCGLACCVLCVVVPGAGCGGLLLWAGVLCDVVAGVGQCEHGGGARMMHLVGLSLVGSPLSSVALWLCLTCLTSLK